MRAQLRERIIDRVAELRLKGFEAAEQLSLSPGQMSRLRLGEDVFALDRLIDAAANIGIAVRMSATRPYRQRCSRCAAEPINAHACNPGKGEPARV